MQNTYEELFDYVSKLEIIDTHEHLPAFESERDKDTDVLKEYLLHYFCRDLISAGLTAADFKKVANNHLPLMERWKIVEPYWKVSRNTGYGRALDIAVKALYGIDKISRATIEELNSAFLKSLEPGHFKKVLKDMSHIKISLLDSNLNCDKSFFRSVYRLDNFICPASGTDIENASRQTGITIHSLDNWLDACESTLEKALKGGAVALKSGLAYQRPLKYEAVSKHEAEDDFIKFFTARNAPTWEAQRFMPGYKFQDYMMHFILGLANKKHLIFQFHTGLQEGNGNLISNSNPSLLSNLFLQYPEIDFDIFHIGYPYQQVLSALAKTFANVYIDMCWANVISPTACVYSLIEWLDSVPANKISAFGGDYLFIDGVYGHQYLARCNVTKALAKKIEDGMLDMEWAKEIAKMLFYDNPLKLFKLEKVL